MKFPKAPLLLLPLCTALPAAEADETTGAEFIQGSLGIMKLDDQNTNWQDLSDQGVEVEFPDIPVLGAELEYTFHEGWVHWGLNPGGSIGWRNDDTNFSGGFNGDDGLVVGVEADNSFFMAELHLGGYVRGRLHERVTTYAAAGPMLMYAYHSVEDEVVSRPGVPTADNDDEEIVGDVDSSAWDVGFYARAGLDFQVRPGAHMGFGVRYVAAEMDFDDTIGTIDVEGAQLLFTYSTSF